MTAANNGVDVIMAAAKDIIVSLQRRQKRQAALFNIILIYSNKIIFILMSLYLITYILCTITLFLFSLFFFSFFFFLLFPYFYSFIKISFLPSLVKKEKSISQLALCVICPSPSTTSLSPFLSPISK